MKKFLITLAVLLMVFAAFVARENSTGKRLIDTGRSYTEHLAAGERVEAYSLLSDSLKTLLTPHILDFLEWPSAEGRIRTGRNEVRGFAISISISEGGSRTLWLREASGGGWKISGDTSLDNLLGNATILCSSFARETVIPGLAEGHEPEEYQCPVSGSSYFIEDSRLLCPLGHLGEGLSVEATECRNRRDGLINLIHEYTDAGYGYPSSFREMFESSGGTFGQRGGYRCPDDGYSYYEITPDGIYCPYHSDTSVITDQCIEADSSAH